MFEELGTAIEGLDIPVDGDALAAVMALRDRLDARISDVLAAYDTAALWELEGATSMTSWLADRGAMARARAAATASRARKLAPLSLSPQAWRDGVLSSGQVDAIAANLDADTLELFAAHEAAVLPCLVDLSPRDVTTAMRAWREAATAGRDPKPERPHALHLSRTLAERWRVDGTLGPETGELLATALRLAQTRDDGQPARSPATAGQMPWVMSAGSSWTTSRPATVDGTAPISTWCSTSSATSPSPPPAPPPPTAPASTAPPSTGCSVTRRCTACSPLGGRRSSTTAQPPGRSRPRCSTPW